MNHPGMLIAVRKAVGLCALGWMTACSPGGSSDSTTVEGDVPVAYVKRSNSALGNPTDGITFAAGGDLYLRDKSSPSATETNVTGAYTQGQGDVSDPEVSYDGRRILFSMRGPGDPTWDLWEYDTASKTLTPVMTSQIVADQGNDVDPAYLPDGRIVFASDRQEKSRALMQAAGKTPYAGLDEYERERAIVLHILDRNSQQIRQISFNQSHDRNPTVLMTGEIMYSRWDHVGNRNQFSIFTVNPDGTGLFVRYGAHSQGNSYLHPREMQNGHVLCTLMPLSRTREGGGLMDIDILNYAEDGEPGPGVPAGGTGQKQTTLFNINIGRGLSPYGRYSTPYPLWDGTGRALVSWTPSQPVNAVNSLTGATEQEEGTPVYGVYMFNTGDKTLKPVVLTSAGMAVLDPVALVARPVPNIIPDKQLEGSLVAEGVGILNVKSVYDTDSLGRMGDPVLTTGESIPRIGGVADLARLKDPALTAAAQRPARFIRITRAVATPSGISMEAIGETEFEMQEILGYTEVEPDGSFKVKIPADVPVSIAVTDSDGRAFTPHTSWVQVRPGETRTCNGCHSARRGNAINAAPIAGNHPNSLMTAQSGESMAETRTRLQPAVLSLKAHMDYTDVWTDPGVRVPDVPLSLTYGALATPVPVSGVINYLDHIQPLWARDRGVNTCTGCHGGALPAADLDLTGGIAGLGRALSYESLLIGDPVLDGNGLPVVLVEEDELVVQREPALVMPGQSRASHLVEVLFNRELRAGQTLVVAGVNHAGFMNVAEKRLVTEWVDLGAQYYNSPFRPDGSLRGVTGLSEAVFNSTIHPILMSRCASCHQPFAGNGSPANAPNPDFQGKRFVLTGNAAGDFGVTASQVNDTVNPANSYLLARPSSSGVAPAPAHAVIGTPPGPVLPVGDASYQSIYSWIDAVP